MYMYIHIYTLTHRGICLTIYLACTFPHKRSLGMAIQVEDGIRGSILKNAFTWHRCLFGAVAGGSLWGYCWRLWRLAHPHTPTPQPLGASTACVTVNALSSEFRAGMTGSSTWARESLLRAWYLRAACTPCPIFLLCLLSFLARKCEDTYNNIC